MKVCFFLSVLLFQVFMSQALCNEVLVVETGRLNLRSSPNRNSSILMVLTKGEHVDLISQKEGWVRVRIRGYEGYLRDRAMYLSRVPSQKADLENARKKKEGIQTRIQEQERLLKRYGERETDVISGLNAIDKTLNQVNAKLSEMQEKQEKLLEKRKKTAEGMADLERESRSKKDVVGQRLTAFYKLESTGRLTLLTATDNIYEFSIHKKALEKVLALDDKILGEQSRRIQDLAVLSERLKKEEHHIANMAQETADQLRIQKAKKEKRKELLEDIRTKKKHGLAAVSALEKVKRSLDQTITKLSKQKPSVSHVSKGFKNFKGLLDLPVSGKIISRFGHKKNSRLNVQVFQSGIGIQADRGEPVRALFSGTVVYADWFSGYGNMMIINHGDHYFSVYAHVEELFKKKNAGVERNEVIATVGDTGSLSGSMLHFEIRQQGKPIDPMTWVKNG